MLSICSDTRDVKVRLPAELRRFGEDTTLSVAGNPAGRVVVVLGGISGNRFVCRGQTGSAGWWAGLVGEGCPITPERFCILGLDFAADPTGRCAPSTKDQAQVLLAALEAAAIPQVHAIVGASYGGMVGLSFAEQFPAKVNRLVIVSAAAEPHPTASAARELQRRTVSLGLRLGDADEALSIARGIAMLTYRTPEEFAARFCGGLPSDDPLTTSEPGYYLKARGAAFKAVMSAERFLSLSASIDRHRVDPRNIIAPALLIGANSDQLVPASQMRQLAERLGGPTSLHLLDCLYGHDMFLKEAAAIGSLVEPFLEGEI